MWQMKGERSMAEYDKIIEEMLKRNFSSVYTSKSEKFNILYNDLLKIICSVEAIDDENVRLCIANPLLYGKYCLDSMKIIDVLTIVDTLKTLMESKKLILKNARYFDLERESNKSMGISDLPFLSSKEEASIKADINFSDFYEHDRDMAKEFYDSHPSIREVYLILETECIDIKKENKIRSRLMSMPLKIKGLVGCGATVPLIDENSEIEKLFFAVKSYFTSNNKHIATNNDLSEYRHYNETESKVYSNFLKSSYR